MTDINQPGIEPRKPDFIKPSPDVPSSTDKKEIAAALSESPEYTHLEKLHHKMLNIQEAMLKTKNESANLSPDDTEGHAALQNLHTKQFTELRSIAKEISDLGNSAKKAGPGKKLHFPHLDQLWDVVMKLLEALFQMVMKGVNLVRNISGSNPHKIGSENAPPTAPRKERTVIGMNLPGGGVAVNPPSTKPENTASPEETEQAVAKALQVGADRQKDIRNELASEADRENDDSGPAPGSKANRAK